MSEINKLKDKLNKDYLSKIEKIKERHDKLFNDLKETFKEVIGLPISLTAIYPLVYAHEWGHAMFHYLITGDWGEILMHATGGKFAGSVSIRNIVSKELMLKDWELSDNELELISREVISKNWTASNPQAIRFDPDKLNELGEEFGIPPDEVEKLLRTAYQKYYENWDDIIKITKERRALISLGGPIMDVFSNLVLTLIIIKLSREHKTLSRMLSLIVLVNGSNSVANSLLNYGDYPKIAHLLNTSQGLISLLFSSFHITMIIISFYYSIIRDESIDEDIKDMFKTARKAGLINKEKVHTYKRKLFGQYERVIKNSLIANIFEIDLGELSKHEPKHKFLDPEIKDEDLFLSVYEKLFLEDKSFFKKIYKKISDYCVKILDVLESVYMPFDSQKHETALSMINRLRINTANQILKVKDKDCENNKLLEEALNKIKQGDKKGEELLKSDGKIFLLYSSLIEVLFKEELIYWKGTSELGLFFNKYKSATKEINKCIRNINYELARIAPNVEFKKEIQLITNFDLLNLVILSNKILDEDYTPDYIKIFSQRLVGNNPYYFVADKEFNNLYKNSKEFWSRLINIEEEFINELLKITIKSTKDDVDKITEQALDKGADNKRVKAIRNEILSILQE